MLSTLYSNPAFLLVVSTLLGAPLAVATLKRSGKADRMAERADLAKSGREDVDQVIGGLKAIAESLRVDNNDLRALAVSMRADNDELHSRLVAVDGKLDDALEAFRTCKEALERMEKRLTANGFTKE